MIGLLVLGLALAHDACPLDVVLRARVEQGPLSKELRACADEGVLLLDDLGRSDPPAELSERAGPWLAGVDRPQDALLAAERAAERYPGLAAAAVARATELSGAWTHPQERAAALTRLGAVRARLDPSAAERHARELAWLGVMGAPLEKARAACAEVTDRARCVEPLAPAVPPLPLPTADDLVACRDVGRLFAGLGRKVLFGSERDCLVRALPTLHGEARRIAGHLVLVLARRHRDRAAGSIAVHAVAEALPDDPTVRSTVAGWHVAAGDEEGAAPWRDEPGLAPR